MFDEGHHLFDAADSTFATAPTGQESIELRRWIVGPESRARGRRRGLAARLSDVASYDEAGALAIEEAIGAARELPADSWLGRLAEGLLLGPVEKLLAAVRDTVLARALGAGMRAIRWRPRSPSRTARWSRRRTAPPARWRRCAARCSACASACRP